MVQFERRVGPKGQVVIPKEIRKHTGIFPGSSVVISVHDQVVMIKSEIISLSKKLEEAVAKDGKFMKKKDFRNEYYQYMEKGLKR